ncbi:MAG: EamA family transporter RarD [Pseudomonadota bacterium]|jgi:chloramphenicol-sensitive protein RarD
MRRGVLLASFAYGIWGLFPLYFRLLADVDAREVLGHRIVWSLAFVALALAVRRHAGWLGPALRDGKVVRLFGTTALLIAVNWYTYIWAVTHDRVVEASLGYFITPLANVLTGRLVLGERLRPAQWAAVGLAAAGVAWLTVAQGTPPWIALVLAASFSTYGLLRKTAPLGALEGLTLETLALAPFAAAGLAWAAAHGASAFVEGPAPTRALLVAAGPLTAVPLLMFAAGARRIPMNVLGMLQYIGPTIQLALGVWLFGEPFAGARAQGFVLIWIACAVFSADLLRAGRSGGTLSPSTPATR